MSRSIDSIGNSLMFLQNKIDVTSNNISNSNSNGFKKESLVGQSFNNILSTKISDKMSVVGSDGIYPSALQQYTPGVFAQNSSINFNRGPLVETGKNTDITTDQGFFTVNNDQGTVLMTTGETILDEQGFLAIEGKGRINGISGEIQLNSNYEIDNSGNVKVDGDIVDKIRTVGLNTQEDLIKTDQGDIISEEQNLEDILDGKYQVGYLESSNVDMSEEMANLMEISRRYETNQRTMQTLDELMGVAINQVGKV
ncbi:MAG: flagellar basal body rod C-terminal domain-containing protein [Clostridia bacterium]